jgi:exopolysaccharide biosynthesis polyprenyl glycosylphosphotransferase
MSNLTRQQQSIEDSRLIVSALGAGARRALGGLQLSHTEHRWLLICADTCLAALAFVTAIALWAPASLTTPDWAVWITTWCCVFLASWYGSAALNDLYHPSSLRRYLSISLRTLTAGFLGLAALVVTGWLLPHAPPLAAMITFAAILTGGALLERCAYVAATRALPVHRRALIVGSGEQAAMIAEVMADSSGVRYDVLGFFDDSTTSRCSSLAGRPVWDRSTSLYHAASHLKANELVVAVDNYMDHNLFTMLMECQAHGMRVTWMGDIYGKVNGKIPVEYLNPTSALYEIYKSHGLVERAVKRMLDLILVLLNLPLLVLLLPVISLAIKLDSPGPIFYRQVRTGRAGVPFRILKFRTMVVNAEQEGKPQWASKQDSRITRSGRILRKTRLDELPQVLNILLGDMSFIGPRPERPEFVAELEAQVPFYRTRLLLKPGLTGWAQVNYEYGNSVQDALIKLQYDLYYVRHWSLWVDIYILFRTVSVVFLCKGM